MSYKQYVLVQLHRTEYSTLNDKTCSGDCGMMLLTLSVVSRKWGYFMHMYLWNTVAEMKTRLIVL